MAQDFTRYIARDTGTSGATIFTSDSDDAVISIRLANIAAGTITADVFVTVSNSTAHIAGALGVPTIVICPKKASTYYYWDYDNPDFWVNGYRKKKQIYY